MTRPELIHEIAEEMARKDTGALYSEDVVPLYIGMAEVAVKRIEVAARRGYVAGTMNDYTSHSYLKEQRLME